MTPTDDTDELDNSYSVLFQAWIALVLLVLCISLLQYLLLKVSG